MTNFPDKDALAQNISTSANTATKPAKTQRPPMEPSEQQLAKSIEQQLAKITQQHSAQETEQQNVTPLPPKSAQIPTLGTQKMKAQTNTFTTSPSLNTNGPSGLAQDENRPSAVIGSKITFKGELSGDEDLLIQGVVEGTVSLKGNQLTVGKLGKVKANLSAQNIIVDGTVEGDLIAEDHIAINASSVVKGNIIAERVTLEDGAKFRGSIDMDTDTPNKKSADNTI